MSSFRPLRALAGRSLSGHLRPPGDKSISHRALILGAVAIGETRIKGLLQGDDVLHTAAALRALGAGIERQANGSYHVQGLGVGGLHEPASILDLGNSGTGARLLMGAVASHPFATFFTGDASLCRRPMARVTAPLQQIGAEVIARSGGRLPLVIKGAARPLPISYRPDVASAQVKSAILLAGLNVPGITRVEEPLPTRDHTENLLRHFGAEVVIEERGDGGQMISLTGQPELKARPITVPGDPSSAAFAVVAALIVPDSAIVIENVGMNPRRSGLFQTLREMGGDISIENRREIGGEPVADLTVKASRLKGIEVPAERAPSMIDEYPILAIAAAFAEGPTTMRGVRELRVKESDRIAAIAAGLEAQRVAVEAYDDGLRVKGSGRVMGGARVATEMDHRIAMSFLVLGLASEKSVTIDDSRMIDTSFPGFTAVMTALGGRFEEVP
jgi:3-phosphoshikimate 1-carboxyvinyltransferase